MSYKTEFIPAFLYQSMKHREGEDEENEKSEERTNGETATGFRADAV